MARSAGSFGRAKPAQKPQPKVLVICEDLKSGKRYVEDAALYYRIKVAVEVVHCGKTDPKGIVEEAIQRKNNYDRVFCIVDRDTHANWDAAQRLANGLEGLDVIASYPCFEYWLILHFGSNRKPYSRQGNKSSGDCCVDDLKKCESMANYDKGKDAKVFASLINRLGDARANSKRVLADAEDTGDMNPSTQLHELIDFFEKLEEEIER